MTTRKAWKWCVNVAVDEPFNVDVPSSVVPSRNLTLPVGVPVAGATGATFAVNVTALAGDRTGKLLGGAAVVAA